MRVFPFIVFLLIPVIASAQDVTIYRIANEDRWFATYSEAVESLPHQSDAPWKHISSMTLSRPEAEGLGLSIPPLIHETFIKEGTLPTLGKNDVQRVMETIEEARNAEHKAFIQTADMVDRLKPEYETLYALAEDRSYHFAETARLWFAKALYLEGLYYSKLRKETPNSTPSPEDLQREFLAYRSSRDQFKTFVSDYPNATEIENAAYHIASTNYHLVDDEHPLEQRQRARDTYRWFGENFPNAPQADKAWMNSLGLTNEIAILRGHGFDTVLDEYIERVTTLEYIDPALRQRMAGIAAMACIHEGTETDGHAYCLQRIESSDDPLVKGSLQYAMGFACYMDDRLLTAEEHLARAIENLQHQLEADNPTFDNVMSTAHYMCADGFKQRGETVRANAEYQKILDRYPKSMYAMSAKIELGLIGPPGVAARPPRSMTWLELFLRVWLML